MTQPTKAAKPIFTRETFRFLRELGRHNKKTWMDANRERYREVVLLRFRCFLDAMAPHVLELDSRFDTSKRAGGNFSRINRDIRFAKDKTPYRTHMYLKFSAPFSSAGETGELYAGISAQTVTAGFRVYAGSKFKESALAQIALPRLASEADWPAKQKKRLSRRYESYWYSTTKGEWKRSDGWPGTADWQKLRGWVVRRVMKPDSACRATFPRDLAGIYRDLYPLLRFTSL